MNLRIIQEHQRRLDRLFSRVDELNRNGNEPELVSDLTRYLCVLLSGFIEQSVRTVYAEYARAKATPAIVNFVESELESFQNPKMGKLLDLTGKFSPVWRAELAEKTQGQIREQIDAIVSNRNRIAHGENVGVSYVYLKDYYSSAKKLVDILVEQCA